MNLQETDAELFVPLSVTRPLGGAFPADPDNPPRPAHDAVAAEIFDDNGRRIAYCWVVGDHANEPFLEAVWAWYERFGVIDPKDRRRAFQVVEGNPDAIGGVVAPRGRLRLI